MPSTHYGIELHHSLIRLKIPPAPTKLPWLQFELTLLLIGKEQVAYDILLNVKIKLLMILAQDQVLHLVLHKLQGSCFYRGPSFSWCLFGLWP